MANTLRAGLDWFSATYADGPGAWDWAMKGIHALNVIADDGHETKACSLNGYQGIRVGGSFVGARHDGYFVQLSGHHADEYFSELMCDECSITRLDFQVTIQFDDMPTQLGQEAYDASTRYSLDLPPNKRWLCHRFSGSDGGFTCYIGAASSKSRGCVYNKDKQANTPEYERCWRYEARFRGELADKWGRACHTAPGERAELVLEVVRAFFLSRGVYQPLFGDLGDVVMPRMPARRTDVDIKLRWLRSQVAPSIKWLQERVDRATLLAALGLSETGHSAPDST